MNQTDLETIYSDAWLLELFPPDRTDRFFDALLGDADDGAYDIRLRFDGLGSDGRTLLFSFRLKGRPGRCLACNLTHGLPEVFSRHPAIGVGRLVTAILDRIGEEPGHHTWKLGATRAAGANCHAVPLTISPAAATPQ